MMRTEYGLATSNTEFLRPFETYQEARQWMCLGDRLYQRTITVIEYDRGTHEIPGDWIPVIVPGISHCAVCATQTDLAPGWGFNRLNLYCVDHWCEITEHTQTEYRWQQLHPGDKQAA